MRIGANLGCNYKLSSPCGLCKEVILYRNTRWVIKYALDLNYYSYCTKGSLHI